MNNKKPLWITLAVFCGVLLLIVVTAQLLRGHGGASVRNDDAPYPYQWTERRDGSVRLALDGSSAQEGVWTADGGDDVATVELGETKRGKATATLAPASEGRTELTFVLTSGEARLAEVRLAVETLQKDGQLAVTVLSHSEQARQETVSGGDGEHPYTAYTDDYGDLVIHIADAGIQSADEPSARWTAASSDELIASVVELNAAEDGVEIRLSTLVNGEAQLTVSSEEAGVTYTFTLTSDSGALRLGECTWSDYVPPSPLTEEELDALLSGVADSLRNLEIAAEP